MDDGKLNEILKGITLESANGINKIVNVLTDKILELEKEKKALQDQLGVEAVQRMSILREVQKAVFEAGLTETAGGSFLAVYVEDIPKVVKALVAALAEKQRQIVEPGDGVLP